MAAHLDDGHHILHLSGGEAQGRQALLHHHPHRLTLAFRTYVCEHLLQQSFTLVTLPSQYGGLLMLEHGFLPGPGYATTGVPGRRTEQRLPSSGPDGRTPANTAPHHSPTCEPRPSRDVDSDSG